MIVPASKVPGWFSYQRGGSSISFQAPCDSCDKTTALLSGVIGSSTQEISCEVKVIVKGKIIWFSSYQFSSVGLDHLWLQCISLNSVQGKCINGEMINYLNCVEIQYRSPSRSRRHDNVFFDSTDEVTEAFTRAYMR